MKFDNEEVNNVASSLNGIFAPLKNVFEIAKRMTASAGDNTLATSLRGHFKKLESTFNDAVCPAFSNFKTDLSQSVENMDAFNRAMASVEDPNTSSVDNIEQKRHTQSFSAV